MLHPWRATIWLLAALISARAVAYEPGSDLFQARTIVTGTDARERPEGFRRTLLDVLVKASGDPSIAEAPGVAAALNDAGAMVEDFRYADRDWELPLHDEQGTEDRPYDLTVRFAPECVRLALASLGHAVWAGERPPLLLHVTVERDGDKYTVTADGNAADTARQAAAMAADRYAMRIVLPPSVSGDTPEDRLGLVPLQIPGAVELEGSLAWSDRDSGYDGEWTLAAAGEHRWRVRGASLDEAFRNAVLGAMKVLSGNGEPG